MTWPQPTRLIWVLVVVAIVVFGGGDDGTESQVVAPDVSRTAESPSTSRQTTDRGSGPASPTVVAPSTPPPVSSTPARDTPRSTIPIRPRVELNTEDLVDRRIPTYDTLAPPRGDTFSSTITSPASADVISRSTWNEECPVSDSELAYAQVSFFGFDGQFHTGELLVHVDYVEPIVEIFARLHEKRFPIEQMTVVSPADLEVGPTGATNNTTIFTCRRSVSSGRWSRHAFGDAVDINPFHNPYVSNSRVIPTLATAYVDRDRDVPGLVNEEITAMFAEIGWGWGGNWNSVKDWMHFSATGR